MKLSSLFCLTHSHPPQNKLVRLDVSTLFSTSLASSSYTFALRLRLLRPVVLDFLFKHTFLNLAEKVFKPNRYFAYFSSCDVSFSSTGLRGFSFRTSNGTFVECHKCVALRSAATSIKLTCNFLVCTKQLIGFIRETQ